MNSHMNNVPISEFAIVIGGYAFKSEDFIEEGIPVIKIKNIGNKKLSFEETDYLPHSFLDIPNKFKIKFGDVLISMTGSHITQPNSAVGRVARSYSREISLLNQRVGKMQVNPKKCDLGFLYHYMSSDVFRDQIGLRSRGAANQANVSGKDIEGIPIPNFSLEAQRKIATILSAYDDLIEINLNCIKLLEEMAQITYEEWFVRLKFPGHETTPMDSETGLPEGWERRSLLSVAVFLNGYAFKPEDLGENGYPIIKIKEIKNGVESSTPRNEGKDLPKKFIIDEGDILFSWSASLEVVIWQYETGLLNQHLFKVIPIYDIPKSFLFLALRESLPIFNNLTTGATMKHIKRKELDFVKIIVPHKDLLDEFNKFADSTFLEVLNLNRQIRFLKEARDIFLPRLMTAMIDVEQLVLPHTLQVEGGICDEII